MISSRKLLGAQPVPSPLQTTEKQQDAMCSNPNQRRGSHVGLAWGLPGRVVQGHVFWLLAVVPGPEPCPVLWHSLAQSTTLSTRGSLRAGTKLLSGQGLAPLW